MALRMRADDYLTATSFDERYDRETLVPPRVTTQLRSIEMINRKFVTLSVFSLSLIIVQLFSGCSNSNPLAPFQPEIANNPDSFQFQATGVTNVSTTIEYVWQNNGTRATINQSSAITGGSATVTLFDPSQVERYSSSLAVNGTFQSDTATAGSWRIHVTLTNLSGTLNFRVQKL